MNDQIKKDNDEIDNNHTFDPLAAKERINEQTEQINALSKVAEALIKENISIRTELKDLHQSLPDMAKAGAAEILNSLGLSTGQANTNTKQLESQPQGMPASLTTLTPGNLLGALLDPNSIQAISNLVQTLGTLYQSFNGNPTQDIALFNEKKLAQIGVRYLYILLNRADTDLMKLERAAGIKPESVLHEVIS